MNSTIIKNNTIFFAVILISISCFGQKKKHTYSDITFYHIDFSVINFTIDEKKDDTLQIEGILKEKTIIDDIPCYGNVTLTRDWKIRKCSLAENQVWAGNTFPKDTYIELGINLDLHTDISSLKHYFAIRGARYQYLNRCVPPSDLLINGILCNAGEGVFFQTNWDLLGCILAEDDTIAGNILPCNTFVRFDHDGTICCFCLNDQQIQGYQCSGTDYTHWAWSGGGGIFFYPGGGLKYFQPPDDIEIQGAMCKRSQVRGGIHLYENGQLKKCTSAIDQNIDGVFCGKNFTLKFDENGKLTYAVKEKIFD